MEPITSYSAKRMHRLAVRGDLSVTEIVTAHIERIQETHEALNAVIYPLFDQALEQAGRADLQRQRGEPLGALFGVPMTVKDQFRIDGTPTSCGLAHRSTQRLPGEGPLVQRLRALGAIFLGKTNLPQLLCSHESEHAHYGRARNPHNPERTPGGSSGGEAAIIAAGGSPLGLGGDMGGSVRVPSHCCGTCGLKPTNGRFPNDDTPLAMGFFAELLGFEGFAVQPGPMAREVEDLSMMMEVLAGEPYAGCTPVAPVGWRGPERPLESLRVGWYHEAGFLGTSPAVRRVLAESVATLEGLGVEVVEFRPPAPRRGLELYLTLLGADGGVWVKNALMGEAPIDDIRSFQRITGMPNALRRPVSWLLEALGQRHAAETIRHRSRLSSNAYWGLTAERTRYQAEFLAAMDEVRVDVLLCPAYAFPAPPHGSNASGAGTLAASYSALYNLLGNPAGVVPGGRVRPGEESDRAPSRDRTEQDARRIEEGSAGLPVGVQVVGRHWREDQVLEVMGRLRGPRSGGLSA